MAILRFLFAAGLAILVAACATAPSSEDAKPYAVTGIPQTAPGDATALSWPASSIQTIFTGDWLRVTISDSGDTWIDVEIDGVRSAIDLLPGRHTYRLIENVPGTHNVRLAIRTDRAWSPTLFEGFDPGTGSLQAPPPAALRMLVIGDDVAAGYGIEGADQFCKYTRATQNANLSFAAIAAREIGADLAMIAQSGRGLVRNYADDPAPTLLAVYESVMADETAALAPEMDVVVVLAGVNDFDASDPGAAFDEAYTGFLARLRSDQPGALIVAGWGPLGREDAYDAARAAVEGAVEMRRASGDENVAFINFTTSPDGQLYGCDWHPSADTQAYMGRTLAELVRGRIGD